VDAAMRILDPIYVAVLNKNECTTGSTLEGPTEEGNKKEVKPWYGLFLKDYFPTRW
jgi:hypothetical protein